MRKVGVPAWLEVGKVHANIDIHGDSLAILCAWLAFVLTDSFYSVLIQSVAGIPNSGG
jgi:hypothetical protein